MVLKKAPSQADAMDFVLVAEAVYVKALMPARPLPPSISDAPDAVLNVIAHEALEGVWVRLNSRVGEAQVEGFGRATGTLSSDPLAVSWCARGDAVVVRETPDNRLPAIVGLASKK